MTDKFQNKYRIESTRLQNWDYRWNAPYFITICTKDREHYFGKIQNNKMELSSTGVIADILWQEITNHSHNIELGEFVVMPNHVHGILILNDCTNDNDVDGRNVDERNVETGHALSLQSQQQSMPSSDNQTIGKNRFQNIGKNSVSSVIGSYKSAVTKHAHRLGYKFAWQTRFYDHIIRDNAEHHRIANYINNNPANWGKDKFR
ncbi:transposase [Saccharicrinis sp. GN24d3]|uniref:transposase n=1 Tax=Saccharicrinis sp. GN24d3 TaxID=3458416 RepID=UPI004035B834